MAITIIASYIANSYIANSYTTGTVYCTCLRFGAQLKARVLTWEKLSGVLWLITYSKVLPFTNESLIFYVTLLNYFSYNN